MRGEDNEQMKSPSAMMAMVLIWWEKLRDSSTVSYTERNEAKLIITWD